MGWINKIEVVAPCSCMMRPPVTRYAVGSRWQCDDCGRKWEIQQQVGPGMTLGAKIWMVGI